MTSSSPDRDIWPMLGQLWSDIAQENQYFRDRRPLLAHYTSISALEQIARNDELWFGNPLFMNDVEEVWLALREGMEHFQFAPVLEAALSKGDMASLRVALHSEEVRFGGQQAFDTYVLCLSEHDADDYDGLLSMWRGYGDSGRGAALVFDGGYLTEQKETPLIISKVAYTTAAQREAWYDATSQRLAALITDNNLSGQREIGIVANALFGRLRAFALFTKHHGFSEEREWRIAYLPERDSTGALRKFFSYFNGPRGVEPKLKLKVAPLPELGGEPLSLEKLVHSIILGPTHAKPLAVLSTKRMLQSLGKPELAERVRASRIPFRPV